MPPTNSTLGLLDFCRIFQKMEKYCLYLAIITGLTACGSIWEPEIDPQWNPSKVDPQWDPETLSKSGCADVNIDGIYHHSGVFLFQFHHATDRLSKNDETPLMRTVYYHEYTGHKIFHKNRQIRIEKIGNTLEVTWITAGIKAATSIIDMTHPFVGCHKNWLILRKFALRHGYKKCGLPDSPYAYEMGFKKTSNGFLYVTYKFKKWNTCSMSEKPEWTLVRDWIISLKPVQ